MAFSGKRIYVARGSRNQKLVVGHFSKIFRSHLLPPYKSCDTIDSYFQ